MAKKKENIEIIPYSTDASLTPGEATSVMFPKSVQEVRQIIISGSNVTVRGAGTGLVGGAVPMNEIVIDMSKMNKVIELNTGKRIVEVEPGVILDELNEELERHGLEFPVQPSSHSVCTIGGIIATNAVGSRGLKYGRTANWIEELEIVSGKGEIIKIGKSNLSDVVGMEGITGIVVRAKLRIIEKRERTASLFSMSTIPEVIESAKKLKMLDDVSAIEFLDKMTSSMLGLEEKYHIIAEFESDRGKAKGQEYVSLMNLRDKAYPALASVGYVRIEDPKIMLQKFQELGNALESSKVPFFGHLGVGIIHPVFQRDEDDKIKKLMVYVKKIHGQITGEHGIGLRKREFLEAQEKKLIMSIKKRYDPLCRINCGKVVDKSDKGFSEEIIANRMETVEQVEDIIKRENEENEKDE